jgi:hypothetical protein
MQTVVYFCAFSLLYYAVSNRHTRSLSLSLSLYIYIYTWHTQKNGAVLIVFTIKSAPFFCVCPVYIYLYLSDHK